MEGLPSGKEPEAPSGDVLEGFLGRFALTSPTEPVDGTPPLSLAARAGDVPAMRALVSAQASVDAEQERRVPGFSLYVGERPLHLAAACGRADAVSLLLAHRADANERGRCDFTPLIAWSNRGSRAVLRVLLEAGVDFEGTAKSGFRALELSVFSGRHAGLQALLEARASCERTSVGLNPLHVAATVGSGRGVVLSLLEARASPNDRFCPAGALWQAATVFGAAYRLGYRTKGTRMWYHCWGATPLMVALLRGHGVEASAMLERGADARIKNDRGVDAEALAKACETHLCVGPALRNTVGP